MAILGVLVLGIAQKLGAQMSGGQITSFVFNFQKNVMHVVSVKSICLDDFSYLVKDSVSISLLYVISQLNMCQIKRIYLGSLLICYPHNIDQYPCKNSCIPWSLYCTAVWKCDKPLCIKNLICFCYVVSVPANWVMMNIAFLMNTYSVPQFQHECGFPGITRTRICLKTRVMTSICTKAVLHLLLRILMEWINFLFCAV